MSKPRTNLFLYLHILPFSTPKPSTHKPRREQPPMPPSPARDAAWLAGPGHFLMHALFPPDAKDPPRSPRPTLGILSFEAARTMSRLVALYHSVSDLEIARLRTEIATSRGVAYLSSVGNEDRLFFLACAERLGELNAAAAAVGRLSRKCSDPGLVRFDLFFADLKLGLVEAKRNHDFGSKCIVRVIEKLERLAGASADLYAATEALAEMEISKGRLEKCVKKPIGKTSMQILPRKIAHLRKEIQKMKEHSLWSMTYDKSVGLMARIVCVVHARICAVFGPRMVDLDIAKSLKDDQFDSCLLEDRKFHQRNRQWESKPGPLLKSRKISPMINFGDVFHGFDKIIGCELGLNHDKVSLLAGPSTVGGSAMTLRYASVIVQVEQCLYAPEMVSDNFRHGLYEMLPERLRRRVGAKLQASAAADEGEEGHELASGWREALEEMMAWLAPVAHDTLAWQAERSVERQRRGWRRERAAVSLVQTLHFSDLEKTEAAMVEALVALSRVLRYDNLGQRRCR